MDKKMMRLIVRLIERGQSDPACEVVAVVGPGWGRPGGGVFVRRFYLRTAPGNGEKAWICIDGAGNYACRRAPAPEEWAPGYGYRGTLDRVRNLVRAFATLPVLALIGFKLEMDCEAADRWKEWAPLLRQLQRGDIALDMEDAVAVEENREVEPRPVMYRRMMREYLAVWRTGERDRKTDETNLRWHVEDKLSIRLSGDLSRMNAIGLEVLSESGLVRDREGWWRIPAEDGSSVSAG